MRFSFDFAETGRTGATIAAAERLFSFQGAISKLEGETDATIPSSALSESDVYDTMFSDSTRGDISPSDLGSGEGSGDEEFTVFSTDFFSTGSDSTDKEESESPASGITTEGKTGTTEFGTEVTESSDIIGTDVTLEGSGSTIEEGSGTSPEEDSSASTDAFSETTVKGTESSAASTEFGSTFFFCQYILLP